MTGGKVHHWKHGWIPISPEAKAFVEGRGPRPETQTLKPALDFPTFDNLSPALQGKIAKKLEELTGLPEPELARRVQKNLTDTFVAADKAPLTWYPDQKADLAHRAAALTAAGSLKITPEQFTGMVSVTSAHKRWKENVAFAQAIGTKLAEDAPFDVTPEAINDYNAWAAKRRGGEAKPHPDLTPGRYRPSELPSDFVASQTPGMPRAINGDYVIRAIRIARGEQTLDETIGGPKQRSFVNNLLDPSDDRFVTMDTWQYKASMGDIKIKRDVLGKERNYTLDEWSDRDLARKDGRADATGYDPAKGVKSGPNLKAILKAADNWTPQVFFQSGPASKADGWDSKNGTYPWFVKQTQIVAAQQHVDPSAFQAVVWYAVGGGE